MNLNMTLCAGVLWLGTLPAAMASSAIEFSVVGKISPGACYPTLGNHELDFGDILPRELQRDRPTQLEREHLSTLNISCDEPTRYAIRGIDERADSVGNHWFEGANGLGTTAKGEKLGAHYVEVQPERSAIDGMSTFATSSADYGQLWNNASGEPVPLPNAGPLLGFTSAEGSAAGPMAVQEANIGLRHFVVIAPASGLTLSAEVLLDGRAAIEVYYL